MEGSAEVTAQLLNKALDSIPKGAVYIGRGTPWGNPYLIGRDGNRLDVIQKYEQLLESDPELVAKIKAELKGKTLVCWCHPLPCHGHLLLRIANEG